MVKNHFRTIEAIGLLSMLTFEELGLRPQADSRGYFIYQHNSNTQYCNPPELLCIGLVAWTRKSNCVSRSPQTLKSSRDLPKRPALFVAPV